MFSFRVRTNFSLFLCSGNRWHQDLERLLLGNLPRCYTAFQSEWKELKNTFTPSIHFLTDDLLHFVTTLTLIHKIRIVWLTDRHTYYSWIYYRIRLAVGLNNNDFIIFQLHSAIKSSVIKTYRHLLVSRQLNFLLTWEIISQNKKRYLLQHSSFSHTMLLLRS